MNEGVQDWTETKTTSTSGGYAPDLETRGQGTDTLNSAVLSC